MCFGGLEQLVLPPISLLPSLEGSAIDGVTEGRAL